MNASAWNLYAPWLDADDYRQEGAIARLRGRYVVGHLIDVTRKATSPSHRLVSFAAELDREQGHGDATVEAVLLREELRETVVGVLELAPRQRSCLVRHANGESYADIAADEGLTRKQVDNAVAKARLMLGRRLAA